MSAETDASGIEKLDAYILCGGLGTRLRASVPEVPKALAPVEGRPFLDLLLAYLSGQGLRRFILCAGHRASEIASRRSEFERYGQIELSVEARPLGTAGALVQALRYGRSERFFAFNGDSLLVADLGAMLAFHRDRDAALTLALAAPAGTADVGSVRIDSSGRVVSFEEKGGGGAGALCNAGAYVISRGLLLRFGATRPLSLERDVFPSLLDEPVYGFRTGGFLDIGTPGRYSQASRWVAENLGGLDGR